MEREQYIIRPIAHVQSDYNEKFGIPRQCGLVSELESRIVIDPEFSNADALREILGFTYIWLIWGFSANSVDMTEETVRWSPTVRPPRLGGGRRVGVWASRSPYRPNSLGMSSVKLERVEIGGRTAGPDDLKGMQTEELALIVSGADIKNGTPIFDIKPYMPYSDSHPEAGNGFSPGAGDELLEVRFPEALLDKVEEKKRAGLIKVLALDPRGAYEKKEGYSYGLSFADMDIRFIVDGNVLTVTDVLTSEQALRNREKGIDR